MTARWLPADTIPEKPPYGTACNGCGMCCSLEICGVGVIAFPGAQAPCPGMRFDGRRIRCAIVETEAAAGLPPMIANALGIGKGCCTSDE